MNKRKKKLEQNIKTFGDLSPGSIAEHRGINVKVCIDLEEHWGCRQVDSRGFETSRDYIWIHKETPVSNFKLHRARRPDEGPVLRRGIK